MPEWLERELVQELRPVRAPAGLWERIQPGRPVAVPAMRNANPLLAAAAILILATGAGTLWLAAKTRGPLDLEQAAVQELRGAGRLDLNSSDPREIAQWIREQSGLELFLPDSHRVELLGARMLRRNGVRLAAVSYRVGSESATLLVARAGDPVRVAPQHGSLSWRTRGQVFAVACANPTQSRAACLLCHASL